MVDTEDEPKTNLPRAVAHVREVAGLIAAFDEEAAEELGNLVQELENGAAGCSIAVIAPPGQVASR